MGLCCFVLLSDRIQVRDFQKWKEKPQQMQLRQHEELSFLNPKQQQIKSRE